MLKIGSLKLNNNIIAAPIAGFTDCAWRVLAIRCGAGLVFSEMVSVEGLYRKHRKTTTFIENNDEARPFSIQLFGSNPVSFQWTFDFLLKYKFDAVDINMGCPVDKVVRRGAGSALMKTPKLAEEILVAVRKVYNGPLTVKIRSGWDDKTINALEMARMIEACGVDAVIVHPRTRAQGFLGKSDWRIIADVKKAVSIPVIGNGDVIDKESAEKMFQETNCDGIMIGRAALCDPGIFRKVNGEQGAANGGQLDKSAKNILSLIKEHASLLQNFSDSYYALLSLKKFVPKYMKGFKCKSDLNREIFSSKTIEEVLSKTEFFLQRMANE